MTSVPSLPATSVPEDVALLAAAVLSPGRQASSDWGQARALLKARHALTEREAEVALQLISGLSVEACANAMGNSVQTIRTHLRSVFKKTGINRQAHLWTLAVMSPGTDASARARA